MDQPKSPDDNQASLPETGIRQEADNSTFGNGQQAAIGNDNIQNQGNNNLMLTIKELILGQQTPPVGNPARPKNERILLASVKEEVTARLRQSLHNAVLINLGKESQPQQVKRPWDAEIKIGLKPVVPLPDTTTILSVFESEEIAGKLLILGNPGSGKTTTQLELAQALVSRAEEQPEYPVPVLFNLSSWKNDRQSITDWLVAELKSKYGVSNKLGKEWVDNHQLLPLLDGLDELEPQRQELCVQLINQFLASENKPLYLVVCSRSEEYRNYSSNLHLNGAICLRELNKIQISEYFEAVGRVEFWQTLQQDETLLNLMITPLFLSITVLSVQELSIEDWQRLENMEARIEHLFDAYWRQQMFNREPSKELYVIKYRLRFFLDKYIRRLSVKPDDARYIQQKPPTPKQTKLWLVWLAKQMQRESKTEFLIEEMQPYWLKPKNQKLIYNVIKDCVTFSLGYGILSGLVYGNSTLINGLSIGVLIGLIFALMNKLDTNSTEDKIEPVENLKFSVIIFLGIFFEVLKHQVPASFLFFLPFLLVFMLPSLGIYSVLFSLINLIIFGLISGLVFGLNASIYGLSIENRTIPNQGIHQSFINAVVVLIMIIISFNLLSRILLFISIEIDTVNYLIHILTMIGLPCGIFIVITQCGGSPAIKHFVLRVILCFNGYIPWNYARFLNYCTERLFLQRVGGRYRFIHKLLQDHFAQMEFRRD
ncbi:NACHT domain-containing protein [Nostoc sp. FACHB-87]|uniref:NACHT domain-containing protein n=1 Tax=Nostocaceae TaxID=1162 RepID=UPI0016856C1F|nr:MULTISPECIES: NACHT domain-containing protein [Nostocaceae]MBD2458481.1 NACHT domain-containing protein [Nostoc sp. FACHB-87]MBD2479548.1 NACHT domain-containing protein [Anabaena sp. FACHB-83]